MTLLPFSSDSYESPTDIGRPEIPNGDREIVRLISLRTGLISGCPGQVRHTLVRCISECD
ncbi:hypothetical protein Ahy_B05g075510 [Arachis hypogaea]|uniref:Uncharacterized protein n=1 Tax=Arachis hypogaea TaxID=3818 RepID=A0A444Z1F0_ARAHY|nr:hypothetical protein Ahy_B05g075510 [Arachis hypogaea]